ncbi:hypothetical protein B0H11DRAFT_800318 [Mycena galericulata]|nr:hypothetical protein B0H11DRAFT_800245 [Mycena galericulata]KAJ7500162.1 hypothetical protein B0H11DRAFT_800318 [Mycena galericulata]
MDEAMHLGFPSIDLETEVKTESYDASVYAGLHKFHEGKGFDPDSQDVARHLEQPLYKLSPDEDAPFAHVSNGEAETEGGSTATTEDKDEDEDEDGSAPEDVDGEIHEVEAESEGSSPATNEDADRNKHTPQDECTSLNWTTDVESVPQSWGWKATMLVKFALILALGIGLIYEYGWAVLGQRDI